MLHFRNSATFAPMILLATAAQAEAAAPAVAAPVVGVGDSWTYQYTDIWKHLPGNLNRLEVTAVDNTGIHIDIKRAATGALISH